MLITKAFFTNNKKDFVDIKAKNMRIIAMKKTVRIMMMALICAFFVCVGYTHASENFNFSNGIISGIKSEISENYTLIVPETIDGEYVTEIGRKAFSGNTNITALDLSHATHLTQIDFGAFSNCAISGTVVLPDSLIDVGRGAFSGNNIDYVIVNNIYNNSDVIVFPSSAFDDTTKLVFNSLGEQEKFETANDTFQVTHKIEIKVYNGSDVFNTGIEVFSGDKLGENLDLLLNLLKPTFGENLVGFSINGKPVDTETILTDGDILDPELKETFIQNDSTITKEYGEDVVVSATKGDSYLWYDGDTLLADKVEQTLTLSNLDPGAYTYSGETYNSGELTATNTYTIIITKAKITVNFNVGNYSYDGTNHEVTFSVLPNRFSMEQFTLKYSLKDVEVSSVINAGLYKAEVFANTEIADKIEFTNDKFVTFSVEKQSIPVSFNIQENYDYLEFKTDNLNPVSDKANATYELFDDTSKNFEENTSYCVGLWRIVLTLKDEFSENYYLQTTSTTFKITPSKLLITWPQNTYVYDNTEHVINYSLNKGISNDVADLEVSTNSISSASTVGSYVVEAVRFKNKNFVIDENSVISFSWSITPKMLTVVWSNELLYYNASLQAPSAVIIVKNTTINLEVTGKEINANENSATPYTASVTMPDFEGMENYALENPTITFRILRKIENLTILDDIVTRVYDGEYYIPRYDYRGTQTVFFKTEKVQYPKGVKEVGEYFLTVYTEDTNNIVGLTGHCMIKILPAKLESNKDNILVEVEDNGGIPLYSRLSVKEIPVSSRTIQFSEIADGDNLKVQRIVDINIDNENEEVSQTRFQTLKFKLKNNPEGLRVFRITTNGLIECAYSIENGYICLEKASMGTYAFLCDKTNWFTSVGIWILCALLVVALIVVIMVFTFKKSPRDRQNIEIASQIEKTRNQEYLNQLKGIEPNNSNNNSVTTTKNQAEQNLSSENDLNNISDDSKNMDNNTNLGTDTSSEDDEKSVSDENENLDDFHDAD